MAGKPARLGVGRAALWVLLATAVCGAARGEARLLGVPSVRPARPAFGQTFTVEGTFILPASCRPSVPRVAGTEAVTILSVDVAPTGAADTFRLRIGGRALKSGEVTLGAFSVPFTDAAGGTGQLAWPDVRLAVRSRLPQPLPERPERLLRGAYGPLAPARPWLGACVLAALIAYLVLMLLLAVRHVVGKSRATGRRVAGAPADLQSALTQLMAASPSLDTAAFYERFSGTVRHFFAGPLGLPVECMTPAVLGAAGAPGTIAAALARLLARADHARFGGAGSDADARRGDVEEALALYGRLSVPQTPVNGCVS